MVKVSTQRRSSGRRKPPSRERRTRRLMARMFWRVRWMVGGVLMLLLGWGCGCVKFYLVGGVCGDGEDG